MPEETFYLSGTESSSKTFRERSLHVSKFDDTRNAIISSGSIVARAGSSMDSFSIYFGKITTSGVFTDEVLLGEKLDMVSIYDYSGYAWSDVDVSSVDAEADERFAIMITCPLISSWSFKICED